MNAEVEVPKWYELLWPTLKALEALGGSARVRELEERLASELQLPDSVLDKLQKEGSARTAVSNNAAWSRTYLKKIGAVDNPSRGVWTITKNGRDILSEGDEEELHKQARKFNSARRRKVDREEARGKHGTSDRKLPSDEQGWKEDLLDVVRSIEPSAFERLCRRILREAGFTKVDVTGRPGDGGIDGAGVLRVSLLSFRVLFQCKRFAGSVGPGAIRDFRGAIAGRADKCLFITTGTFTAEAGREAAREGAQTIDLIDGDYLCDLLKEYGLGVEVVESIDRAFFEDI